MKILPTILLAFGTWFGANAQGYIVPNGVMDGGYDSNFGYSILVNDNPTGKLSIFDQYTLFWLNPIGKTPPTLYTNTFSIGERTDIGVRVFLVPANAAFTFDSIQSGSFTELVNPSYVFQSGIPFYLGLYTGIQFAPPYPPNPPYTYLEPVFGWAKLVNNQGVIQLLDSGLAYQAAGIYAGTQTLIPVPEPTGISMAALGLILIGRQIYRSNQARPLN